MNIKIEEGFPEVANLGISTIAVVLNDLFKEYGQSDEPKDAVKVSTGLVSMPIVAYLPSRLNLKTTAIKNTHLDGRFSVYSKQEDDARPCGRFILEKRHITKEEFLKQIPKMVLEASFNHEPDFHLVDLIQKLDGIYADQTNFFYNLVTCEGYVMHCMAIIHEYGKKDNPYCVGTTYLSIQVNK